MSKARPPLQLYVVAGLVGAAAVAVVAVFAFGSHRSATVPARGRAVPRLVAEAPDPLAAKSFALPARSVHHAKARSPHVAAAKAREAFLSPGAPSDQQVIAELQQEQAIAESAAKDLARVVVDPANGDAIAPAGLPLVIQEVIAGGNAIRDFPYVYGGGHASFIDDAYDCSGSVSYALAAGGLIGAPETSGQLESWGKPGPGRYITVFATDGHTFMWVDGVWFDTAGRAGPYTTRWLTAQPPLAGYVERHPVGL
jgi:cell wall-associated NlpC family hydrolase